MENSTLSAHDGRNIPLCHWPAIGSARGIGLIAHGLSEYAARYERFALQLAAAAGRQPRSSQPWIFWTGAVGTALPGGGLAKIEVKVYASGRHEMHHETNREEFMTDLLQCLNRVVTRTLQ